MPPADRLPGGIADAIAAGVFDCDEYECWAGEDLRYRFGDELLPVTDITAPVFWRARLYPGDKPARAGMNRRRPNAH